MHSNEVGLLLSESRVRPVRWCRVVCSKTKLNSIIIGLLPVRVQG